MRLSLLFFIFSVPSLLLGQSFLFNTWDSENGLNVSDVNDITQDPAGYLWVATEGGGLAKFDGLSFQHYTTVNGLPSDFISSFAWNSDSLLCIGTEKGICFFDGLNFQLLDSVIDQDLQRVVGLQQINDTFFVAFRHRLAYFYKGRLHNHNENNYFKNQKINHFGKIDNRLVVVCDSGIIRLPGLERIEKRPSTFYFSSAQYELTYFKDNGELWQQDGGMPLLLDTLKYRNGVKAAMVWQDSILVYTANTGIVLNYPNRQNEKIAQKQGLPLDRVKSLFEDKYGNLWLGGFSGLSKWVNPNVENYTTELGLHDERVHSVLAQKNKLWFGTNSGLEMLDENGYHTFKDLAVGVVFKIIEDHNNTLWLGTESGLYSYSNKQFKKYGKAEGLDDSFVFDIIENVEHQLIVSTSSNVFIKKGNRFESIFSSDDEAFGASSVRIDHYNRLWLNPLLGSLALLENNVVKQVEELGNTDLTDFRITGFDIEMEDKLWIGTLENGVLYWNGSEMTHIDVANGLVSNKIMGVLNLDATHTWVLTDLGLQLIVKEEGVWQSQINMGYNQGFLGNESYNNAIFWDADNQKVWAGTKNGAVAIATAEVEKNTIQFKPDIFNIDLFFEPTLWEDKTQKPWGNLPEKLNLNFDENYLTFYFGALTSGNPNELFYRYKLKGQDPTWTIADKRREAVFTDISPGNYAFQVEVSASGIFENAKMASIVINIVPPFYKTFWFWLIVAVIIIGMSLYAIQFRLNQLNEKRQLQTALVESERKALRLQMNPHFIFNALDSISGFIFKNEAKKAVIYLNSFAKLMRLTLESSRNTLTPLHSEINLIKNYLLLEQVRFSHKFEFSIHVSESIDPYVVMLPPMVIQPNLENAILHGLRYKKEKGILTIRFITTQEQLICEIKDNGVGREVAMAKKKKMEGSHKGLSVNITKERMGLLSKSFERSFEYKIDDLKSDKGECLGTKVTLTFPLIEDDGFDE